MSACGSSSRACRPAQAQHPFAARAPETGWRSRAAGRSTCAHRTWASGSGSRGPGWLASVESYLGRRGGPIRYAYAAGDWDMDAYQTIFGIEPGSAEMPSAGRPFTSRTLAALAARDVQVVPIVLHCGVSSLEDGESPLPERFAVSQASAARLNAARGAGGRVIAIGTTAVRALESAADAGGHVHAASGWTDVVIGPDRAVAAVDGLLTGWHEPGASHLDMIEAIAGSSLAARSYEAAVAGDYLWHEFGDVHLILP